MPKHSNRLQPYSACFACRSNKKRCSGSFPCLNCINKGQADSCQPATRNPRESRRWSTRSSATDQLLPPALDIPSHHAAPTPADPGSLSPEAPHQTHPRMLRNLQGERVYVGKAASLSFLQLLRDTVNQHIGPSQFSHNVRSEDMLETETPHHVASEDHFNRDQKRAFVETYFMATSGFIHVVSESEAIQLLDQATHSGSPRELDTGFALVDIMIAIGAQSCKSNPSTIQAEQFFFARGQQRAFVGMLENPSIDLVRLFLLMSFYMLGACRRNAAFMYLGVASRAAVALGLHSPDSSGLSTPGDQQQRSRVWMSMVVLDLLVSSILGRPPATATLRPDIGSLAIPMQQDKAEEALIASYRMSLILDEIITRLYGEKSASAEAAESLLGRLNQWSQSLPNSLLASPASGRCEPRAQGHILGSFNVACSYHFAVIVVTRPFLISSLSLRLARTRETVDDPSQIPQEEPAHSRLATACIDSATYMMQTCMEVHHSQLLLGNMCILKAFTFAAALVLGFSMFSQKEVDPGLEEAFTGAIDILRLLSRQSAQAAHYSEILTMLSNAITEQRQRLTFQRRQSSQYVSKLFSLNDSPPHRHENPKPENTIKADGVLSPVSTHANNIYQLTQGDGSMTPDVDALFSGWEGLDLPLWDSFPFLTEPVRLQDRSDGSQGL